MPTTAARSSAVDLTAVTPSAAADPKCQGPSLAGVLPGARRDFAVEQGYVGDPGVGSVVIAKRFPTGLSGRELSLHHSATELLLRLADGNVIQVQFPRNTQDSAIVTNGRNGAVITCSADSVRRSNYDIGSTVPLFSSVDGRTLSSVSRITEVVLVLGRMVQVSPSSQVPNHFSIQSDFEQLCAADAKGLR